MAPVHSLPLQLLPFNSKLLQGLHQVIATDTRDHHRHDTVNTVLSGSSTNINTAKLLVHNKGQRLEGITHKPWFCVSYISGP